MYIYIYTLHSPVDVITPFNITPVSIFVRRGGEILIPFGDKLRGGNGDGDGDGGDDDDDDDDDDDCDCCYDYVFDDDLCECGATSGLDGRC